MKPAPDELLADRILAELVKRGLVPASKAAAFAAQIAGGTFLAEDWVRLVEQKEDGKAGAARAD